MFQDVNVMIFVGFGFLMTFMRNYSLSALCFNFLLSVFTLQLSVIMVTSFEHVWEGHYEAIHITIISLTKGLFACGAVLISMGAVLGKLTHSQMMFMAFIEIIFYCVNENIGVFNFKIVDMGGSIFVHTFGA